MLCSPPLSKAHPAATQPAPSCAIQTLLQRCDGAAAAVAVMLATAAAAGVAAVPAGAAMARAAAAAAPAARAAAAATATAAGSSQRGLCSHCLATSRRPNRRCKAICWCVSLQSSMWGSKAPTLPAAGRAIRLALDDSR